MTKHRRTRSDSIANLQRIAALSDSDLAPPAHVPLSNEAEPFWLSLIAEKARADWTSHELEVAAMLALSLAQLEAEQRTQREEGFVVTRANGNAAPNPRNRVVNVLTAQVLSYRRSLGLTARAKAGGRSEDAAARRIANRDADRGFREGKDDLLA